MTVKSTFDPMSDLLMAQSERPAHVGNINLRTLTPFQRALLVIDGTVTKFIESYTMEPVEIIRLNQETKSLSHAHSWLEATTGTSLIVREVLLRGKYTYTVYAYAVSLIVPDRLQDVIKQGLEIEGEGIGRILYTSRVETYREVLWYGRECFNELPPSTIRHLGHTDFLSRTYRIIAGGKPIMLINEKFPLENDQLPAHQ